MSSSFAAVGRKATPGCGYVAGDACEEFESQPIPSTADAGNRRPRHAPPARRGAVRSPGGTPQPLRGPRELSPSALGGRAVEPGRRNLRRGSAAVPRNLGMRKGVGGWWLGG
eukprot:Skav207944  [mRNA]  locus=scaffold108:297193:298934:+ [translate_table: standard]